MRIKSSISSRIFDVINYSFLIILALVCLYPLLYVLFGSVSEPDKLMKFEGILLFPQGFTFKGYELVFKNPNIVSGFINTIYYTVLGTAINIVMTSICAYVISNRQLVLNKFFSKMITFTMLFGGGLIPSYILIKELNLDNSVWALVLPGAINVVNMNILRSAFEDVPSSLIEAARIDGANDVSILTRIILPVSKPSIAVISLYYCVAHWNSWFPASIYLKDRDKFPIQVILREVLIQNDTSSMISFGSGIGYDTGASYTQLVQYCTIIIATVPILFIYPFLQRYFVKGVMIGAVKE